MSKIKETENHCDEARLKMKLPDGYEPHELPADYAGKLFTENQMMECCGKWLDDVSDID